MRSRGYLSLWLVFGNELDTFAKKVCTVPHLGHPSEWNAVRVVNIETLISELTNVSHIGLPERARSRGYLSLCLVFYSEFDTFVEQVTTVTRFGHQGYPIHCKVCQF